MSELVRSSDRRLCCVLAYGAHGNLVELFAEQLFEHLRRNVKEVAQVYRIPMRLPTSQSFDDAKVAFEVRRALGLSDRESFGAALTARKPRGPGRACPVFLLDWGVRGTQADLGTKLEDYVLNPNHRDGRHKAHVFQSVLGITLANANILRQALLREAATSHQAEDRGDNGFGRGFVLRFPLTTSTGSAIVLSAWIIRHDEAFPRLTTCYIV